jgi:putative hydrolases of HD superfamily
MERLERQLAFLLEADKLKTVFRRNLIADGSRTENDAEHSWTFALAAVLFAETAREPVDLLKVVRIALIHDVVEVDAGDTFIYDEAAKQGQREREERAAQRLFGLLPEDQARELLALWHEFEEGQTKEARFARAIDRLAAVVLNHASQGRSWRRHGVTKERILEINSRIDQGSPALWRLVQQLVEDATRKGYVD